VLLESNVKDFRQRLDDGTVSNTIYGCWLKVLGREAALDIMKEKRLQIRS
jgi:hypothetical protein